MRIPDSTNRSLQLVVSGQWSVMDNVGSGERQEIKDQFVQFKLRCKAIVKIDFNDQGSFEIHLKFIEIQLKFIETRLKSFCWPGAVFQNSICVAMI